MEEEEEVEDEDEDEDEDESDGVVGAAKFSPIRKAS